MIGSHQSFPVNLITPGLLGHIYCSLQWEKYLMFKAFNK